jgi:hypothetical protein
VSEQREQGLLQADLNEHLRELVRKKRPGQLPGFF